MRLSTDVVESEVKKKQIHKVTEQDLRVMEALNFKTNGMGK